MNYRIASLILALGTTPAFARSDLTVKGLKFPNSHDEGISPVLTRVETLSDPGQATGYTELLPYVLRSPDQEEAGSCLYMSLTGIAEWWLARLNPTLSREPDGPIDLSERYFMNLAGIDEGKNGSTDWKTDSIYLLNQEHHSVLNKDYRFAKGWYTQEDDETPAPAAPHAPKAVYDAGFSWINQLDQIKGSYVDLPHFERKVIFADPASNQWDVGVAPEDIVETVKEALTHEKAPVQVIYNHMGYWHSVFIVGFDDSKENGNCHFVEYFRSYMSTEGDKLEKQAESAATEKEKSKLLAKAARARKAVSDFEKSYLSAGGCHPQGVFYVRDSIYPDENGPIYDYDPAGQAGDPHKSHYTKPIVMHEYDWLRHLANHVVQITAEPQTR